jgi:site-specific DNA-methyltransferase (adenine-specific)
MTNTYIKYNDDCFNILNTIEDGSISLIICDLPFGVLNCKWDSCIDLKKLWVELLRIGKLNCAFIFFCTTKYGFSLIESNKKLFRYDLVWHKHNGLGFFNANKMPLRNHEMIYVFYRHLCTYNVQKTPGKPYKKIQKVDRNAKLYGKTTMESVINNTGDRYPLSVLKIKYDIDKRHPTQKPVALLEWLIKTYSNENETILDPTAGSFSCLVACRNTNRSFIGIEKDKEIFDKGFI